MFALSSAQHANAAIYAPGNSHGVIGIRTNTVLHRFDIDVHLPTLSGGVRATNTVGEPAGRLALRWMLIPYSFLARPDREPPPTLLDPSRSQRFTMQEGTFTFGEGQDGFHSFGTGRTFPMLVGGRAKLVAAAVGNITEGFGKFRGYEGNFTLCGDLTPEQGFVGHIIVRIHGSARQSAHANTAPTSGSRGQSQIPGTTFLTWVGQKGTGPEQKNRFSFAPDGQVRGVNVATELKRVRVDCTAHGPEGFRCSELRHGGGDWSGDWLWPGLATRGAAHWHSAAPFPLRRRGPV